jgi:hypothetical protein
LRKFTDRLFLNPLKSSGTYQKDHTGKMPDQTVKHDNSLPGFLLILLPAAFGAVFLSVAWPFILGAVVLLTGNSVWQSYQWAKLSQQVNPYFMQMVLEQQGEIAPLALSARANISAPVADRYLQGKAAEIGGVSYRSATGGNVYSFLTVGALENTFVGLDPTVSISEKLADMEYVVADTEVSTVEITPAKTVGPALTTVEVTESTFVVEDSPITVDTSAAIATPNTLEIEQPIASSTVAERLESIAPIETVVAKIVEVAAVEPVTPVQPVGAEIVETNPPIAALAVPEPATEVLLTDPVVPVAPAKSVEVQAPSQPSPIAAVETTIDTATTSGSTFAQALRSIFNAENTEPVAEEAVELEPTTASLETISQTDLAKRLDVHPSTLYKRRSDVSFGEWTRNRDPEGVAWGYQRDTKEFYRLT